MSVLQTDADGYAVPAADLLADFLTEHGDDPLEGDPADWPECPWVDDDRYAIGPPLTPEEVVPDLVSDDEPFDPDQADVDALLDMMERAAYEAGCQMRFI
jgi:hypothetical protein